MEAWKQYLEWIRTNPDKVTDVENGIKWVSYFFTFYLGRSKNALLLSEIVQQSGALIKFINDRAFEKANAIAVGFEHSKIECFLGFIETSEAILELSGQIIGGPVGKWAIIITVQILKTTMRGLLLYKRHQMLKYPTIDPLIRDGNQNSQPNNQFSKLKSGKIIRRLDTEGRQACRTWDIQDQANALYVQSKPLGKFQILGEIVYITEPLAYLSALKVCGHRSWKPWVLALGLDVTSQMFSHQKENHRQFNEWETKELNRRRNNLAIYLMRSPFYDNFTKQCVLTVLICAKKKIPFTGMLIEFILTKLPHYRNIYAYLWAK